MEKVYLTGYTPYPLEKSDSRLPHLAEKMAKQIHKTALGTENFVPWQHLESIDKIFAELKISGFMIAAVEQAKNSVKLPNLKPPDKIALLVGREVEGIEPEILAACDMTLEIPMLGQKESFNVVQAAAMALYHCRFPV